MNQISWQAAVDGRYWINVNLGALPVELMLDLGLVDPLDQVAFDVEPQLYDSLRNSGQLVSAGSRPRRDSSGRIISSQVGLVAAQLRDSVTGVGIGPQLRLLAFRGIVGVPSRVGVVFFHRLAGCRVVWNLDARIWSVEYP